MNLTRCSKGHFYDADTSATCPHCLQSNSAQETMPVMRSEGENQVTVPLNGGNDKTVATSATSSTSGGPSVKASVEDDNKTVRYNEAKMGKEPVVGWLVCINGAHIGEDFRLKSGKNFIGRNSNMDAALTKDTSVSRDKHAIVVYEPKSHIFLVQPGEARELCYLNENVVLSAQEIKRNDIISVGDSKLMLFPCCDSTFNWEMVEEKDDKENK